MKLRTASVLASLGVLLSSAGALAVPLAHPRAPEPPRTTREEQRAEGSRITIGDTLTVDARLGHASLARSDAGETLLFAQVSAPPPASATSTAPPLSLALVVDRSGSMKGERIAKAIEASVLALERLRDGDTITVVTFDTAAQVVVPPTRVSAATRPRIDGAIRNIRLGGDTCISCGLEEGMRQLASVAHASDHVDRMLLLSDGATNAGVRDVPGLRAMASRMLGKGVTVSTIGVDVDFDEKVMAAIASEANGRHHFVASASGLPQVFADEFDDVLASSARDAELVVELAPGVEVAEVFDRSFRRDGNRLVVPFGTFSARQEKTVLVKLRVDAASEGVRPVADVKLAYRDLVKRTDGSCHGALTVSVRADGSEQKELDPFVAARLERSRTAQTLTDANRLFESGNAGEARARLAARRDDLARTKGRALALAAADPDAAPLHAQKPIDEDFAEQIGVVDKAERTFAQAPPRRAGPLLPQAVGAAAAPPPSPSREEKVIVRENQAAATSLGF